jgi:hypothetical protein
MQVTYLKTLVSTRHITFLPVSTAMTDQIGLDGALGGVLDSVAVPMDYLLLY